MWKKIAAGILKYRILLLVLLGLITAFMGYQARKAELSYTFTKAIPTDHPKYVEFLNFQKKFGDDGSVILIGTTPKNLFDLDFFNKWYDLSERVKKVENVTEVLSIPRSFYAVKDTTDGKIKMRPIFPVKPKTQLELDSLKHTFYNFPFYEGLLYSKETNATLIAITVKKGILNSKAREAFVNEIKAICDDEAKKNGLDLHYSGLPFIRATMATKIQRELNLFMILSAAVTGLVLLLLLRSLYAVIFSMVVVGIAATWSMGSIVLFGYQITLLTGLIPPLIVVIGITNCVYLLNKYHIELVKHGDKNKALHVMIEKIGLATLFTNLTAAIGFGVFFFTKSQILKEFGLVAGLNIVALFVISIIVIPTVFSLLPNPRALQMGYLNSKLLNRILNWLDYVAHNYRKTIFGITGTLTVVSLIGMTQLVSKGYIVDDVPKNDKVYLDLKYFESNFKGILPLDILVEGKDKNALKKGGVLKKMDELQDTLATYSCFSKPLSIVEAIKIINQANKGGDSSEYKIQGASLGGVDPNAVVLTYLMKQDPKVTKIFRPFIDSTNQTGRISVNIADIGSTEMKKVFTSLKPKANSIFDTTKYKVIFTGSSVVFVEGLKFITDGLIESLILAFILIGICMGYLFRSVRMIIFSLLPNLVPLLVTAGAMGYFNIPLKPSTVLIYSIAFGIAVDNAIRFLAKYQQELHNHDWDVSQTVSAAIREAGLSIIYTSIILFFGFVIFTASDFGGTFYLGLLTSLTLVVAMFNNLLLLPAMLLALSKWTGRKSLKHRTPADDMDE